MAFNRLVTQSSHNSGVALFNVARIFDPPIFGDGLCFCGCGGETPLATKTRRGLKKGEPIRFLNGHKKHLRFEERDCGFQTSCWVWLLSLDRDGYGYVKVSGQSRRSHVVSWEQFHDRTVPNGYQLDHLCRVRACIRPQHLEPVTSAENTRRGIVTELSLDQVLEIRKLRSEGLTQREIAIQFGVKTRAVSDIVRGATWYNKGTELLRNDKIVHHGSDHYRSVIDESDVIVIRHLRASGSTIREIADKFGVSHGCIAAIVHRRTWTHVA